MLPVMKPMVCIGPPNPSTKPPPHGTRHCQKQSPVVRGVLKLKVTTSRGPDVHGEVPQRFAVSDGEAIGIFRLMLGIENVCATLQPDHELISLTGLPLTSSPPPVVPVTWPKTGFRSGVQPS